MEVYHIQSVELGARVADEQDKQRWAEEHARLLQRLFEQWQKPLGIDGEEYRKHLARELSDCYDEPLRRSLIELIP
jgi:hypothetical protein